MISQLLTEKMRPKRFEHLILPARVRAALNNGRLEQNVLLYGPPGTGKTSAAFVLTQNYPTKYINVSDESSVEVIRTTISDFCKSYSVVDDAQIVNGVRPLKYVILDEADGASDQFFKALRGTVEQFAKTTRFIITCNYENKIPEAIHSRFEAVNFDAIDADEENDLRAQWTARLSDLLPRLGISASQTAVSALVDRYFPDLRSVLNRIQSLQTMKITELTIDRVKEQAWDFADVYNLIIGKPDPVKNYEFLVGNYGTKVDDVMDALGSSFVKWLGREHPDKAQAIPQVVVAVAHHQAQRVHVIDPVVSMLSLVFTLQKALGAVK